MTSELTQKPEDDLYQRIAGIISSARSQVVQSVNTAMVHSYWLIGREIVEVEQQGDKRAKYGTKLIKQLSVRLTKQFGKGFTLSNIKRMRQFYLAFPNGSLLTQNISGHQDYSDFSIESAKGSTLLSQFTGTLFPPTLSWSHYSVLMRINDALARSFYEIETSRENWSVRELERQVASLLFERLVKSCDKEKVLALATQGQKISKPSDVIKDPMVLEFLELEEHSSWLESDLEQAIIDRLETFLLELGKGFCFVARQKRITLEGDHFYVDLVFYNRLLRCFVLVELKLGKLTHKDLGQIQMYVNYFDRYQRETWEAPTVGIVLCSEKNDAMVRITLPENNTQIHTSKYQLYLPTENQLRKEIIAHRARIEQVKHVNKNNNKDTT